MDTTFFFKSVLWCIWDSDIVGKRAILNQIQQMNRLGIAIRKHKKLFFQIAAKVVYFFFF